MTSLDSIYDEKTRFRQILIGISLTMAAFFLLVGMSFYRLLADQARLATQGAVTQLLEKHRESFALEIFLHKSGAYQLRIDEIIKEASAIVKDFGLCLYRLQGSEIIASTFPNCVADKHILGVRDFSNGRSEIAFPLEAGQEDDRFIIKARYRDAGSIFFAVQELPWTIILAVIMLGVMIFGISRILDRYNHKILAIVSRIERENHTNRAIALTSKMLAHDIRRPFTMIEGMLGLLETTKNPGQLQSVAKRHLPDVRKSMKKINLILSDINLMEIHVPLKLDAACPEALIESSLSSVFKEFKNANIKIEYQFNHTHQVFVDEVKGLRVFENIFCNAIQAMQGSGIVKVTTREIVANNRGFIEFQLANSGRLISDRDLANLFEPFFTKDKRGGTGLGLAICKQIVCQHGGIIQADNLKDRSGVVFSFTLATTETHTNFNRTLPAHSSDYSRILFESEDTQEGLSLQFFETKVMELTKKLARKLKILIADDEALYRASLIEQILGNQILASGIDIFEAGDVEAAIQLAEKYLPDLVIMDINFSDSERDGFDAVAAMRERGVKAKICMHSNQVNQDQAGRYKTDGADCFLPKPMKLQSMLSLFQSFG